MDINVAQEAAYEYRTQTDFFDIDGTIVTEARDGRIIPDSIRTALRKLQQNGHLCFINTGRALAEIDEPILQLQMDGLVCGSGTYITYSR